MQLGAKIPKSAAEFQTLALQGPAKQRNAENLRAPLAMGSAAAPSMNGSEGAV